MHKTYSDIWDDSRKGKKVFQPTYYGSSMCSLLCQVEQSVVHMTWEPEVRGSIPGAATYFRSPSPDFRRAVVSCWWMYVHLVLVNCLGGLSLPRNSVVKLTACLDVIIAVCTVDLKQQNKNNIIWTAGISAGHKTACGLGFSLSLECDNGNYCTCLLFLNEDFHLSFFASIRVFKALPAYTTSEKWVRTKRNPLFVEL